MRTLPRRTPRARQHGMVLVISLLLLVVVTILAVGLFRSFGIDEKIAGNIREKQLALNAAETAEQNAETWLQLGLNTAPVACTGVVNGNVVGGQVCNKTLKLSGLDPAVVPWTVAGAEVGVDYQPTIPTAMQLTSSGVGENKYYKIPRFYVAYLGSPPGASVGAIYQIDAVGYGGSSNTVAVVESTYVVRSSRSCNKGELTC